MTQSAIIICRLVELVDFCLAPGGTAVLICFFPERHAGDIQRLLTALRCVLSLRSSGGASSPQPAPDLPTYLPTYPGLRSKNLPTYLRSQQQFTLLRAEPGNNMCVILKESSLFPLSAVDSQLLYTLRMLSARAARENFKEIDVLASQIPKIFSETYLPTYLPAGGRQPPTYLPTSRPMPHQTYVGRESTKRCRGYSFAKKTVTYQPSCTSPEALHAGFFASGPP